MDIMRVKVFSYTLKTDAVGCLEVLGHIEQTTRRQILGNRKSPMPELYQINIYQATWRLILQAN
jgi:hypothetical protein